MSYSTIEAAVQTLLRALTGTFASADVSRGDYRILDSGGAPYAVLRPGSFERDPHAMRGEHETTWTVVIELFEKHLGDGTEMANLEGTRQAVIDQLDKYPQLNACSGVLDAMIVSGDEPRALYDRQGGGPYFLLQTIMLEVHELTTATGGDW